MKNLLLTTLIMTLIVSSASASHKNSENLPLVKKLWDNSVIVGMFSSIFLIVDLGKARNTSTPWTEEKLAQIKNELSRAKIDIQNVLDQIPLDSSACYLALEDLSNRGILEGSAWTMQMDGKDILSEDERNVLGLVPHKAKFKPTTEELQAEANQECK